MSLKAYKLSGCIWAQKVSSAGVATTELRKIGNVYPLSIQVSTEQKKQISAMCDTAGQTLHTRNAITEIIGSLTMRQWDARNLAWALSGTETERTGTASTVTDENVTALPADEWAEFAYRDVSSVVIQDVTDTTTYVEGTDYTLNAVLGMMTIISTGSITATDVLHVDYSYAAETGYRITVGTRAQSRVRLYGALKNEFASSGDDDEYIVCDLYQVVMASNAEINLVSDPENEYDELPFTLSFETPTGQTTPGIIDGVEL